MGYDDLNELMRQPSELEFILELINHELPEEERSVSIFVQGLQLWRFRAKVAVLKGQGRQKFVAIRHAKSGDFGSLGGAAKLWRFWAKKWRF